MPKVKRRKKVGGERTATGVAKPERASRRCVSKPTDPPAPTPAPSGSSSSATGDMARELTSRLRVLLTSHVSSHPECKQYATSISKYMRNQFVFMGLKAPARRALQKEFVRENGESLKTREVLAEFMNALWEEEEREFQACGVDLLAQYKEVLLGETEAEFWEAVGVAEHCVVTKSWWDTVDAISYPGAYQ